MTVSLEDAGYYVFFIVELCVREILMNFSLSFTLDFLLPICGVGTF